MKKTVIVALVLFWTIVVSLLSAGFISYETSKRFASSAAPEIVVPQTQTGGTTTQTGTGETKGETATGALAVGFTLSAQELAKHKTPTDCWLLIDGAFYNVTGYLYDHPGGAETITPYCGKDGTQAFATKDKSDGSTHSKTAHAILAAYKVGNMGEHVGGESSGSTSQGTAQTSGGSTKGTSTAGNVPKAPTTSPKLSIGANVAVQENVLVRSGPSQGNTILGVQAAGKTGMVIGGPQFAGGYWWWQINYSDGPDGWSAQDFLAQAPVSSPTSNTSSQTSQTNSQTQTTQPPQTPSTSTQGGGITMADVALHNTSTDCWMVISGNVYNVGSYIQSHPGGAQAIISYCGKDGTQAFATKGKTEPKDHSASAHNMLAAYLVGPLGTSAGGTQTTSGTGTTQTQPPSGGTTTTTGTTGTTGSTGTGTTGGNCAPATKGVLPCSVTAKYPNATIKKQSLEDDGRQELEILTGGSCRTIKTNSSGAISSDNGC